MWILLILAVPFIILILISNSYEDSLYRPISLDLFAIIFGVFLFIHLLCWSVSPIGIKRDIKIIEAQVETIENARKFNDESIDNAAITNKVVDINSQIESLKFMNAIWFFDCYIPDEVNDLELIKY
jgi:hypothetical protein